MGGKPRTPTLHQEPGAPGPSHLGTWETTNPMRANSERLPHRRWLGESLQFPCFKSKTCPSLLSRVGWILIGFFSSDGRKPNGKQPFPCEFDGRRLPIGNNRAGSSLRGPPTAPQSRLRHHRHPHPCAWHRSQHGGLQRGLPDDSPRTSWCKPRSTIRWPSSPPSAFCRCSRWWERSCRREERRTSIQFRRSVPTNHLTNSHGRKKQTLSS
jgi:hypothetical protein